MNKIKHIHYSGGLVLTGLISLASDQETVSVDSPDLFYCI